MPINWLVTLAMVVLVVFILNILYTSSIFEFFKVTLIKIVGMNLQKHRNVKFRSEDNMSRLINSVHYDRHEPLFSESETQFFEIVSKKKKIRDCVPIRILNSKFYFNL